MKFHNLANETRNNGIDFLRGFSILSVMLLHCSIHMPFKHDFIPKQIYNILFGSGYYGVIVFFVISGFLITNNTLIKYQSLPNISLFEFYKMRFARIMPCLLTLLIILSVLDVIGLPGFRLENVSLKNALFSALTFHINWLEAKHGFLQGNWDVLWSLSIEEMFYLFFPLLCLLSKKISFFIFVLILFIIIGPLSRTILSTNEIWLDHAYLSCMDGIAVGCLSAILANRFYFTQKQSLIFLFFGIFIFSLIMFFRTETNLLGLCSTGLNVTFLEASIGLILLNLHRWRMHTNQFFRNNPICWLGSNSYEIYLIHGFFVLGCARLLFSSKQSPAIIFIWYFLSFALSGMFGQLIAVYFSNPMNKWIRRKAWFSNRFAVLE